MMETAVNDGIEIAFEVEGDGVPLVLLHGFTDTHAFWREQGYAAALMKAGRQIVLIDARGHGASDKPREPELYTLRHQAGDVIAVLDALEIARAEVLGYSMGGRTALALACHHPERLRAVVAGGAHPHAQSMQPFRDAIAAGLPAWIGVVEGMAGPLLPSARARWLGNDAAALAAVVACDRPDISAPLARSGVPLLLYAGDADPLHAPAQRFAERSGAAFVSLPGLNHMQAALATAAIIAEVVAFLDGSSVAGRLARA